MSLVPHELYEECMKMAKRHTLRDYQQEFVKDLAKNKKFKGVIVSTPRGSGKTTLSNIFQQIFNNAKKEKECFVFR